MVAMVFQALFEKRWGHVGTFGIQAGVSWSFPRLVVRLLER